MPIGTKPPPRLQPGWNDKNHGQKIYSEKRYNEGQARRGYSTTTSIPHTGTKRPSNTQEDATPPPKQSGGATTTTREPTAGTSGIGNVSSTTMAPTGKGGVSTAMDTSEGTADSSSVLPGTAQGQGAGGGDGGPGPRAVCVPRPRLNIHNNVHTYNKTHRFLTWGIAYDILSDEENYKNYAFMSTPFAQLPWDRPYFYLTPAEYASLPEGSIVKNVKCTITPRNCRVAFPTNSSENNLATLNQNKDVVIAYSFNVNVHSVNAHYETWNDKQPMIPTTFTLEKDEHHTDLAKDLYGNVDTTDTVVPRHQAGIWTPLPNYALIPKPKAASGVKEMGWPCLQHYYKDFYADSTSGVQIESFSYTPAVGNIKKPFPSVYTGLSGDPIDAHTITIPRGSHRLLPQKSAFEYTAEDGHLNPVPNETTQSVTGGYGRNFTYFEPIEKSQEFFYGNFQHQTPRIQPSVHIGVQPVPALTTAAIQGQSNSSFTDVSAYFEVTAEMEVELGYPTPFPLMPYVHVTEHLNTYRVASPDKQGKSTYNGLFQM